MNARLPTERVLDAMETGEFDGKHGVNWRACPYRETPLRGEWLAGWIRGFFGGAIGRQFGKSSELKDKYLAAFHEERGRVRYRHYTTRDWELVEVARAMTPPLKWPVLAAMVGHPSEALRQRAIQRNIGIKRRVA